MYCRREYDFDLGGECLDVTFEPDELELFTAVAKTLSDEMTAEEFLGALIDQLNHDMNSAKRETQEGENENAHRNDEQNDANTGTVPEDQARGMAA